MTANQKQWTELKYICVNYQNTAQLGLEFSTETHHEPLFGPTTFWLTRHVSFLFDASAVAEHFQFIFEYR